MTINEEIAEYAVGVLREIDDMRAKVHPNNGVFTVTATHTTEPNTLETSTYASLLADDYLEVTANGLRLTNKGRALIGM